MLRVLILDDDTGDGATVALPLQQDCRDVRVESGLDALQAATLRSWQPDVLFVLTTAPTSRLFRMLTRALADWPIPTILFTQTDRPSDAHRAVQAGVTSYIVAGLDPSRLHVIIETARERFAAWQRLATEYESLRADYERRRLIERAKGAMMAIEQISEPEAHRMLQSRAMRDRQTLVEAARAVLESLATGPRRGED